MVEGIEFDESSAALGPEGVRRIQDVCQPPLHCQRRTRNADRSQGSGVNARLSGTSGASRNLRPVIWRLKEVTDEARVCPIAESDANQIGGEHYTDRTGANEKALARRGASPCEYDVARFEARFRRGTCIALAPRDDTPINEAVLDVCNAKKLRTEWLG
jgi:hypothetical protein